METVDVNFFNPLPIKYEKENRNQYLIWENKNRIVRYKITPDTSKDLVYGLDFKTQEDYYVNDPTVDDVQKLLDWLYE